MSEATTFSLTDPNQLWPIFHCSKYKLAVWCVTAPDQFCNAGTLNTIYQFTDESNTNNANANFSSFVWFGQNWKLRANQDLRITESPVFAHDPLQTKQWCVR